MSTTTPDVHALPVGTWNLDPLHSTAAFAVAHNGISIFRGRFEDWSAGLEVAEDGTGRLTGVVKADSIAVRDKTLAQHLRAPDFFDTEVHPEVRFTSTAIRVDGGAIEVAGDLQIKGHTRPVVGTGTISEVTEDPFGGTRVALTLETEIDRTDYGMDWNMAMPRGGLYLAREVTLSLALELTRT